MEFDGHPRYTKGLDVWLELNREKVQAVIDDVQVNFIDLANLKKNKKATARYQDLEDLENLG